MPRIQLGSWVNDAVDWLTTHMASLFDFCKTVFLGLYDGINAVLQAPEPLLLAGIFAVIAFWLRGTLAGVLTFAGFAFIDSLELWENAMITLALVLVATVIALVISIPVGVWAARAEARVRREGADRRHPLVAALGVQRLRADQAEGPQEGLRRGQHDPHHLQREVPRVVPAAHEVDQELQDERGRARQPGE